MESTLFKHPFPTDIEIARNSHLKTFQKSLRTQEFLKMKLSLMENTWQKYLYICLTKKK